MSVLYGKKHGRFPRREMDVAAHGSASGARAHWRRGEEPCEACRQAEARRRRDRQRRNRLEGLPPGDARHGVYGYNSFNCRCGICVELGRAKERARYRKRVR